MVWPVAVDIGICTGIVCCRGNWITCGAACRTDTFAWAAGNCNVWPAVTFCNKLVGNTLAGVRIIWPEGVIIVWPFDSCIAGVCAFALDIVGITWTERKNDTLFREFHLVIRENRRTATKTEKECEFSRVSTNTDSRYQYNRIFFRQNTFITCSLFSTWMVWTGTTL